MARRKNPAAVALSRLGAKKGGVARAARLTPEERSDSARRAVLTRWARAKMGRDYSVVKRTNMGRKEELNQAAPATAATDTSDHALFALLQRIKTTDDLNQIRQLSDQLERVIFHKQFKQ
ncbi:MAG: hypothetical protein ABSH44_07970 [Bryobacteraceae bacterium]|jgi:hypothetical protein